MERWSDRKSHFMGLVFSRLLRNTYDVAKRRGTRTCTQTHKGTSTHKKKGVYGRLQTPVAEHHRPERRQASRAYTLHREKKEKKYGTKQA